MAVQTGDLCALADASNRLSTQMSWLPLSLPRYTLPMPVLCENSFQCVCHLLAAMGPWYSYQSSAFSHLYKGAYSTPQRATGELLKNGRCQVLDNEKIVILCIGATY